MNEDAAHSVTGWILKLSSPDAAEYNLAFKSIHERYLGLLLKLARDHLATNIRRREDENDILQSVFLAFDQRQKAGRNRLTCRGDLLALLADITRKRTKNVGRKYQTDKRNHLREQSQGDAESQAKALNLPDRSEPTPDEAASFSEYCVQMLDKLKPQHRPVALCKLEGLTDEEAARKLDCSVRSIERKMKLIRSTWESEISD